MAERRIALVLEWFEAHPEQYENVRKKINTLAITNQQAANIALKSAKNKRQEVQVLTAARDSYADEAATIVRKNVPGYRAYEDIQNRVRKQQERTAKSVNNLGLKFQVAGWRIGFFGWIVSYSARSVFRIFSQLYQMFEKILKVSADWPTSLFKVAYALALLESRGLLTADMEELLRDTMGRLIEQGPDFQALWAGFEASLIAVATILTSKVVPAMSKGLAKLAEFILENEDRIADIAERFFSEFIPALIDAIPAVLDLVEAFIPLLPIITQFLRLFAPLLPALFVLGSALWTLGPILTTVGVIFGGINKVVAFFTGKTLGATVAATGFWSSIKIIGVAVGKFAAVFALFIGTWTVWGVFLKTVIKILEDLFGASNPVVKILKMLYQVVNGLSFGVSDLIMDISGLNDVFEKITVTAGDVWEKIKDLTGGLFNLCFVHASADAQLFERQLGRTYGKIRHMQWSLHTLGTELRRVESPTIGVAGGAGGFGTQHVTIYAPISIDSVSAEIDIERLKEEVNKEIADGVRRRR